ncbi:hypothetical protein PINS_up001663 [Pythium insidiosum]|nr:hypothetical protein PINS_up001663 [Pythium insidiosum]
MSSHDDCDQPTAGGDRGGMTTQPADTHVGAAAVVSSSCANVGSIDPTLRGVGSNASPTKPDGKKRQANASAIALDGSGDGAPAAKKTRTDAATEDGGAVVDEASAKADGAAPMESADVDDDEATRTSATETNASAADANANADANADADADAGLSMAQLSNGLEVDVFCTHTKKWLPAKIESTDTDGRGCVVHFMGWSKNADEVISPSSCKQRIAARGSEAADEWAAMDRKKAARKQKEQEKKMQRLAQQEAFLRGEAQAKQEQATAPPSFVEVGATRSGRRLTKRLLNEGTVVQRKKAASEAASSKKKSAEESAREIQEESLCGTCGEFEDDALTDMIFCDGGCLNSYHISCLGLDSVPEEDTWLCEQCRTNEQQCFACGRNGTIGERGGVFRCSVISCGKFYHQSCINASKLARRFGRAGKSAASTDTKDGGDADEGEEEEEASAFRCPRHVCSVCENSKKSSDLMFCLKCPESYHPHCVPPSARYNNVGLLCYRHPHDTLPRIPAQFLLDRNFDSVVVDFNLRLPTLYLPPNEPKESDVDDCHHFRLQIDCMETVKKQPPTYRTLVRNIYTFKQTRENLEDIPMCVCKDKCGDDCINRLSFIECFGSPPTAPGSSDSSKGERIKEFNCPLGENCGNRALHQRIYPRFERFHTAEKGWGLKVLEPVKAGQLVIEYVGEVINEEEKNRRLSEHARLNPEDKNMYIMELSNGVYIDARHKGSVSRFINHSCDPNCRLLKWNVRGVNRIAITAVKDIAAGEELSYDYQFHTSQAMEWRCFCKAKGCRGTMAPEKLRMDGDHSDEESGRKLTKKERAKKIKRAMIQERIQNEKEEKATLRRLSLTAPITRTMSRTGPPKRELSYARHYRLFLTRNAARGFDFLHRKELRERRNRSHNAKDDASSVVKTESSCAESTVSTEDEGLDTPSPENSGVRLKVVLKPTPVEKGDNAQSSSESKPTESCS